MRWLWRNGRFFWIVLLLLFVGGTIGLVVSAGRGTAPSGGWLPAVIGAVVIAGTMLFVYWHTTRKRKDRTRVPGAGAGGVLRKLVRKRMSSPAINSRPKL